MAWREGPDPMPRADLILLHPPSVYDFRERPIMYGPISDVVPSTPIFEMYPIGFMTLAKYLEKHGFSVRIINVAVKMLRNRSFNAERLIKKLNPLAFGIDLHWLAHAHGGLELAKLIKKHHPPTPVIFGGLSASYYHEELINYPQVDYVIRGDSAEEPLRQLLQVIKQKDHPQDVTNLTWQNNGKLKVNELSYCPTDLNTISFDYSHMMKSTVYHKDLVGYLPFQNWLHYPIVAILPWRGCKHNCVTCGGAAKAYQKICGRQRPAYRSPELLARDIDLISTYLKAPIMILGDIRQAGTQYVQELLSEIKKKKVNNHIALELFSPASQEFLKLVADCFPNFNLQISPESHDVNIRKSFGRNYDNKSLEMCIESALKLGCNRIDLFFMIGLPHQTPESVRETVKYCELLIKRFNVGNETPIHPYISPLAPFLDPGSPAFENPVEYGYRLFYKTLEEHRQALVAPSWKHALNYETEWMNRDEIVSSTYKAALKLNRLKGQYGLVKMREAKKIETRIKNSLELINKIDNIISIEDKKTDEEKLSDLRQEFQCLRNSTICKKNELQWITGWNKFNFTKIIQIILKEIFDIFKFWRYRKEDEE